MEFFAYIFYFSDIFRKTKNSQNRDLTKVSIIVTEENSAMSETKLTFASN